MEKQQRERMLLLRSHRALHLAATEGRIDVLTYLLDDLRLDVNQTNDNGETPLFLSAFFGRTAATRYLLYHGADPMILNKAGSPLHGAARKGHSEIVEMLLSRGTDIVFHPLCGTPLHTAATWGQGSTMKILLDHDADPNKVFNLDDTPLIMAISSKSLDCVKLLIQAGADVNFRDSNGATYVMMAANYGFSGIMKCLLDAGANPNIPDDFGAFPIEVAALQDHREIVEIVEYDSFALSRSRAVLPEDICGEKIAQLKLQGKEAFRRKEYLLAGQLYTKWPNLAYWPKACYRQGAAFMLLKEYKNACEAFADGLKLDPTNVDIEKALRAAFQAMKNDR
uniref:Uncharacterized protein n=1 Tax=Leersia perrieri TaxID=77586 RepID=A0A0D9XB91_9ORYZ